MIQWAEWLAPIATTVAAMMTAANLGARVTGWGFIIFTAGSLGWSVVGIDNGQANLLWTNVFLTLVNAIGIWRWLGRQASYDDSSNDAARRSAASRAPSLFSVSNAIGQPVLDNHGNKIGRVIDIMAQCAGGRLDYVVVSEGGVAGIGERLHALDLADITFTRTGVISRLSFDLLKVQPVLEPDQWPSTNRQAGVST